MNQDRLFTTLALAATLAISIPTAHAEYVNASFEARIQAAAADGGPAEVSSLLYRTRTIYNLSLDEAMQHVQSPAAESTAEGAGSADAGGSMPEETSAGTPEDSFTREFFRNDPRD